MKTIVLANDLDKVLKDKLKALHDETLKYSKLDFTELNKHIIELSQLKPVKKIKFIDLISPGTAYASTTPTQEERIDPGLVYHTDRYLLEKKKFTNWYKVWLKNFFIALAAFCRKEKCEVNIEHLLHKMNDLNLPKRV